MRKRREGEVMVSGGSNSAPDCRCFFFSPVVAATTAGCSGCTEGSNLSISRCEVSQDLGMGQDRTREKMMGKSTEGVSLGEILTWLDSRMDEFLARHCKALSTGRLFLLPSSSYILSQFFPQVTPEVSGVLRCVVLSLCSLNGEGIAGPVRALHTSIQC